MRITNHAIKRAVERGFVKKKASVKEIKRVIEDQITNHMENLYISRGAKVYVCSKFAAITVRDSIITVRNKDVWDGLR